MSLHTRSLLPGEDGGSEEERRSPESQRAGDERHRREAEGGQHKAVAAQERKQKIQRRLILTDLKEKMFGSIMEAGAFILKASLTPNKGKCSGSVYLTDQDTGFVLQQFV